MKQEFTPRGSHRLVDGEQKTQWVNYTGFVYLNGKVGVTDYFTGKGEMILTPQEFCEMAGAGEEEVVETKPPEGEGE